MTQLNITVMGLTVSAQYECEGCTEVGLWCAFTEGARSPSLVPTLPVDTFKLFVLGYLQAGSSVRHKAIWCAHSSGWVGGYMHNVSSAHSCYICVVLGGRVSGVG